MASWLNSLSTKTTNECQGSVEETAKNVSATAFAAGVETASHESD